MTVLNRVTELSENVKLRLDMYRDRSGRPLEPTAPADPEQLNDAEAQMRKALGLDGPVPRPKPEPERVEPAHRPADRFAFSGHRRRFVQDGDIPVTVVRRDPAPEPGPNRLSPAAPTSSRLQRVEAQLAAEVAARAQAERILAETQSQVRDLQTKLGHAELARNEALEAARQDRETIAEFRGELAQHAALCREAEERALQAEKTIAGLQDALSEESAARQAMEEALRLAEEARDNAERLVRELTEASLGSAPFTKRTVIRDKAKTPRVKRGRAAKIASDEPEPEPIKWWLTSAPAVTRSRRR